MTSIAKDNQSRVRQWLAVVAYLIAATLASAAGFVAVAFATVLIDSYYFPGADIDEKLGILIALTLGTLPAVLLVTKLWPPLPHETGSADAPRAFRKEDPASKSP